MAPVIGQPGQGTTGYSSGATKGTGSPSPTSSGKSNQVGQANTGPGTVHGPGTAGGTVTAGTTTISKNTDGSVTIRTPGGTTTYLGGKVVGSTGPPVVTGPPGPGTTPPGGTPPGGGGPPPSPPNPIPTPAQFGLVWPGWGNSPFKKPGWYAGPPKNAGDLANLIRNAWFAFLGDLSQYPYNSVIVTQFQATISLTSDGGGDPGVYIDVWLATVNAGDGSLSAPLANGTGTTDSLGTVQENVNGSFSKVGTYVVVVDVYTGTSISVRHISAPYQGSTLYSLGYQLAIVVATKAFVSGSVTLDKHDGKGAQPASGVTIKASFGQVDAVSMGGQTQSLEDGSYHIEIDAAYLADGSPDAQFDQDLEADWGTTNGIPNIAAQKLGSVNGAYLAAGITWDVALEEKNGQVTQIGSGRPPPPQHHQRSP